MKLYKFWLNWKSRIATHVMINLLVIEWDASRRISKRVRCLIIAQPIVFSIREDVTIAQKIF